MSSQWAYWAVLSAIFAALTAVFAKVGVNHVDPDLATFLRVSLIAILLALFVSLTGKWSNPFALDTKSVTFLALSALATGASWVCYFRALKLGSAYQVAPVDKLSVVLVAIFAIAFLGERPTLKDLSGIAMISAGVLLLAWRR